MHGLTSLASLTTRPWGAATNGDALPEAKADQEQSQAPKRQDPWLRSQQSSFRD